MPGKKADRPPTPEICPVCGEDVPRQALACSECGADHQSGWRDDAGFYDAVDLPGEFDYEELVREEFGGPQKVAASHWVWWLTAVLLLGALIAIYFQLGR